MSAPRGRGERAGRTAARGPVPGGRSRAAASGGRSRAAASGGGRPTAAPRGRTARDPARGDDDRRSAGTAGRGPARGAPPGRGGVRSGPRAGGRQTGRSAGGPRDERADGRTAKGLGGDQVEGRQAVRELLVAGRRRVREVLMAAEQEPAPILDDIRELCLARRVTLREIGRGKFESLVATQSAQGVLARAQQLEEADLDGLAGRGARTRRAPFLVALDGVTDPGNLGALLRSAEGAGVSGVVLPRHRSVHVTPAVTKAAAGAVEYVPIALVGGLPTALAQLGRLGVWTIGLDGGADRSLFDLTYLDEPVCLVLGAEGRGLSRLARERCHELVSIPLGGQLNSLNVAAAGSVACFEVARQRDAAAARPVMGDLDDADEVGDADVPDWTEDLAGGPEGDFEDDDVPGG